MDRREFVTLTSIAAGSAALPILGCARSAAPEGTGLWQAEGVANLDQVPATGALVAIGFPRFKGGTGGFASFTAICPENWTQGARPGDAAESPLAYNKRRLVWNEEHGVRERTAPCDKLSRVQGPTRLRGHARRTHAVRARRRPQHHRVHP
jgi:hypothetical protein